MGNQYAGRDIMGLDKKGGHYSRHLSAMTGEALHDKSDIAAELAYRDARIAQLEADCAAHKAAEETQIALRQKADERVRELEMMFVALQDGATDLIHATNEDEAGDAIAIIAACNDEKARKSLVVRDAAMKLEGFHGYATRKDSLTQLLIYKSELRQQAEQC